MKSYTDLEQSKKLAEILSLESADSHYVRQTHDFRGNTVDGKWSHPKYGNSNSRYANYIVQNFSNYETIPCWSLAALLDVLPKGKVLIDDVHSNKYKVIGYNLDTDYYDEPLDACVAMIEKLHEQKLL